MVGIIIDDDASTIRGYVRDAGITWPVDVDPKGGASLGFGTTGQPETYVIAPDGVAVCGSARRVDARRSSTPGCRPRATARNARLPRADMT